MSYIHFDDTAVVMWESIAFVCRLHIIDFIAFFVWPFIWIQKAFILKMSMYLTMKDGKIEDINAACVWLCAVNAVNFIAFIFMFSLAEIYSRYITRFNENLQCLHTIYLVFFYFFFCFSCVFSSIQYFPCHARSIGPDTRWKDINASDWIVDRINACDHRCLISIQCTQTTTPKGFGTPTRYRKVSHYIHIYSDI